MGDSLIGKTSGFDPDVPGSSPGPPAFHIYYTFKASVAINKV